MILSKCGQEFEAYAILEQYIKMHNCIVDGIFTAK